MIQSKTKPRNIQRILMTSICSLLALSLGLSLAVFSYIEYRQMYQSSVEDLQQTCQAVAENIRLRIDGMDTVCLNTINSTELKDSVRSYVSGEELKGYEKNQLRSFILSMLTTFKGFDFTIRQLSIYSMDSVGFGSGNYIGIMPVSAKDAAWFTPAREAAGRLYVAPPGVDAAISKSAGTDPDRVYVSLYRLYYNSYHIPAGFVEVKAYYDSIFSMTGSQSETDKKIYIYARDGSLIYPLNEPVPADYFIECASGPRELRSRDGLRQIICCESLDKCGFTVVCAVDTADFLAPVIHSLLSILGIFVLLLSFSFILSVMVSRRLATPIRQLDDFLRGEVKDRFETITLPDTGIREIDGLKHSINSHILAQKRAEDLMLNLKERELQAQMLALQSQMNPHFLYNSLSSIAEMARQGMDEEVARMAEAISQILRYISSNRDQVTSIEEELELTSLYLECMKLRFGESLVCRFDIADEMLDAKTPKLCVQLLVENSIKSATTLSPPWKILVRGWILGSDWFISVLDNGPGFDSQVDLRLRSQMDDILQKGILPSLQIEGMGILNIFIRLYMLDGPTFIFDFGNRPEGGAFVTIGGHLKAD